jgi:CHAT domain-containing protein/lipopolysaccharide biosynthesis regulator YciM
MCAVRRRRAPGQAAYWSAACCTLLPVGLSAAAHAAQPCRATTRATVTPETPFRCDLPLAAGRSVLVRVDQAQVDVTVELLDSTKRSLVKVDSPTRRAGPELLLASAPASTTRTIVIASSAKGTTPLSIIEPAAADAPGLALLTASAAAAAADAKLREANLRSALTEFRKTRAARHEAEALSRIAATDYWVKGDWVAAAASAQEAMNAWEELGDRVMWSQAAVIRAASLIETAQETQRTHGRTARASASQFDAAEELLSTAAGHFREAGRKYDEAHALNTLGHPSFYRGRNDEARAIYTRAAAMFRELNDPTSEALPLQNLAVLDQDRGDYAHAIESYERLLARMSTGSDPLERVSLLNNAALVYDILGNTDKALQAYMSALAIAEPAQFAQDRARTLHGLGNLYLRLGARQRAGEFLRDALQIRRTLQPADRRGLYASLIAVGEWHRERGEHTEAIKLHVEAYEHAVSAAQKARAHLAIGGDHLENDSIEQALASYERGLAIDLPDHLPVRALLKSAYGDAKLRSGDPVGYALITSAASTHRAQGNDELAAQDFLRLAQADVKRGRMNDAVRNVGTALALFERHRASAMNPDLRATYVGSRAAAYELQAEIQMTLAERARSQAERERLQLTALATVATRRTRALMDFRQLAEPQALGIDRDLSARQHRLAALLDQQDPPMDKVLAVRKEIGVLNARLDLLHARDAGPSATTEAASIDAIDAFRAAMPEDTIALAYLLGDVRSWLWTITRRGVQAFALENRARLDQAARELQELWSRPLSQANDRGREEIASRTILGGASALLASVKSVQVIPDGELRRVPFAALRIPTDGGASRLVETHAVTLLPSLRFAANAAAAGNAKRMLLLGDPLPAPRAPQRFETDPIAFRALPGTRRELAVISEVAVDWEKDVLSGARATKQALFGTRLGSYRVLHFATHGRADVSSPQLSALMLSPAARGTGGDAALSLREIVGLDLNADLVVLSACEGALGKQYRGQLSFGLSEAFLLGGSRTVVGSLWRVSDAATQRYMTLFYDQYIARAATPAAAAQRAARVMINDPKYAHPFYWAAFVVLSSTTPTRGGGV